MGGSQYQAKLLVERLVRCSGLEIFYLTTRVDPEFEPRGYRLVKFSSPNGLRRYGFFFDFFRLYRALARIRPDVVYQQVGCAHTGIAALYARRNGCRMVWRVSSDKNVSRPREAWWRMHRRIERRFFEYGIRHAGLILAQTRTQQRLLAENYGRDDALLVRNFHPVPAPPRAKPQTIRIVWIANFKPVKNPEAFVRLAERLAGRDGVELVMIGATGPPWARTRRLLARIARTPNLEYLGARSQEEVNAILEDSHILVNTSHLEGYPNTFIQAWMRGVAVASLHVDPDGMLSAGRLGLVSSAEDGLLADVTRLIESPDLRGALARRGRDFAVAHHSEANMDSVARVLELGEREHAEERA